MHAPNAPVNLSRILSKEAGSIEFIFPFSNGRQNKIINKAIIIGTVNLIAICWFTSLAICLLLFPIWRMTWLLFEFCLTSMICCRDSIEKYITRNTIQILICETPIHCRMASSKNRNSGCSINSPVTKEHPENKRHMQKTA